MLKKVMRSLLLAGLLVCAGFASPSFAAGTVTTTRTETRLVADVATIHAGTPFWALLHVHMKPGWHTYWKNPGDSGTVPGLKWTLPNGFRAGDVQYQAPERLTIGPLVDYGYDNDAYYLTSITPPPILQGATTAILMLKAQWLVCKDICVPEQGELSLALPASGETPQPSQDAALIGKLVAALPIVVTDPVRYARENGDIRFVVERADKKGAPVKAARFFPATDGFISYQAEQKVRFDGSRMEFIIHQAEGSPPAEASGVVSLDMEDGSHLDYDIRLVAATDGAPAGMLKHTGGGSGLHVGLFTAILLAIGGGLTLNLMPCVFPILSLKALAVARKAAKHPAEVRAQGFAYLAGVLVSFLALAAVLVGVQQSGQAVGWGYQMQSPVFVASLALIVSLVGLNLSGYFELPFLFGGVGQESAAKDTRWGSFLTGALAVLIATPCTAPLMAPAIGFALTRSASVVFLIFAALGFGLALPFLGISLIPSLGSRLPRPGAWMVTFRQLLAFPLYLTAVWLFWVLSREAGADAAAAALTGLVVIALAIWTGKRRICGNGLASWFLGLAAAVSCLAIIHAVPQMALLPQNLAQVFSPARLASLRAGGVAVFVDATADWCITCKVNESVALSSHDVQDAFGRDHIAYLVADWTHGDSGITEYLASFGRSGVPIYVFYPAHGGEPVVLPQILTPSIILKAIGQ